MVDLEPFLDAPFESASNLSFELLLASGVVLLACVSLVGRTTVTMLLVSLYVLAIPGYVAFRIRVWDGEDGGNAEAEGTDENGDESDDENRDEDEA